MEKQEKKTMKKNTGYNNNKLKERYIMENFFYNT